MKLTKGQIATILVIALLIIDQIFKIWIKTHMTLDESIAVFGEWFYLRFIENPGAAYGMTLGGDYGKLALSLIRIVAIGAIIYYVNRLIKRSAPMGVVIGFAFILAGAIGNVLDSVFYGVMFTESTYYDVAQMVPWGDGYSTLLHGNVVDMLYFPIIEIERMPDWFPIWGGEEYTFFSPVFNMADSYVTCGFVYLLLFQRSFFK